MPGFISHPDCRLHDAGPLHPECASRLDAIENQMLMSGLDFVVSRFDAPEATTAQLERVHEPAYIARLAAAAPAQGYAHIDDDTVISPGTMVAARRAAGAGILGVDLIMSKQANPVFCAVRPPGHHAERNRAMGFCLFNNIAVAAAHALEAHGLKRIAIVDFDVHHGNGTEDIFAGDERVLVCSAFQHPFYPFTGHASDAPNLVAVPLPAGTNGAGFRTAIREHWLPALEDFRPEFVFVSAGFDGHLLDPMADWALTEADYEWTTRELIQASRRHAAGRLLSMLEGGYETGALARSVIAHVKAMLD